MFRRRSNTRKSSERPEPPRPSKTASFYVDECTDDRIGNLLESRGHMVYRVGADITSSADDRKIAKHAHAVRAIVITSNRRDFEKLCGKKPRKGRKGEMLRGAGCLFITQDEKTFDRVADVLHIIESFIDLAESWSDKRLFVHVENTRVIVLR
jgi:hypothetical protein